ncbi:MAG: hypothetical protein HY290_04470 [Planctomycetia bacterium]|nr:hypothetical protein [Planctomycetia bacterium]
MKTHRWNITLACLALCIGFVLFIIVREVILRRQTADRAARVKAATLMINDFWNNFPESANISPTGSAESISSWRFRVLCTLRHHPVKPQLDAPWNATANQYYFRMCPVEFCRPRDPHTCIVAITGAGTPFNRGGRNLSTKLPPATIMIVERKQSLTHWMEPADLELTTIATMIPRTAQLGADEGDPHSFFVGFADNSIWRLSNDVPMETLLHFATADGAKSHDRDQELRPYRVR